MAVTITSLGFNPTPIKATSPLILDNKYKPNKIMYEWVFSVAGTGDASGGAVGATANFRDIDSELYHVITSILIYCTASTDLYMYTLTDQWKNFYNPIHVDEEVSLWTTIQEYRSYPQRDQLNKPLYLGRAYYPENANGGLIYFSFSTNTESAAYNITMQGYSLERPLPFSSILQP